MLKSLLQKILRFFSVTKDDLPKVETVEYGSGSNFAIYRVGGRPVVVWLGYLEERQIFKSNAEQKKFDENRPELIKISKAQFVDYYNEEPSGTNRYYPRAHFTKFYDEPLSDNEKEALLRFFESIDYSKRNETCERLNGDLVVRKRSPHSPQPTEPEAMPRGLKPNDVQPR